MIALEAHRRVLFRVIALAGLAWVLAGCAPSNADLDAYIQDVKSRPGPPLDPLPVMKQFETFEYSAFGLRDPFNVPKQAANLATSGPRPDPNRRRELLESFPLDGLEMVGSLGTSEEMVALVVDPESVVHRVRVGSYMGQNEGRVVSMTEGEITLVELIPDGSGGWEERDATIALDDEE